MNIEKNTYNLLKTGLDASTTRNKAITHNLANINTKGYKKFEVVFEENLQNLDNSTTNMKKTSVKHMDLNGESGNNFIDVVQNESGPMTGDGNSVDVDMETMNLVANKMKFDALVSEINARFRLKESVIKGGR